MNGRHRERRRWQPLRNLAWDLATVAGALTGMVVGTVAAGLLVAAVLAVAAYVVLTA